MNIDAEITKKIRRQRAQPSTTGELKDPRLLSNSIDLTKAVERLKQSQADVQSKKKRTIVI